MVLAAAAAARLLPLVSEARGPIHPIPAAAALGAMAERVAVVLEVRVVLLGVRILAARAALVRIGMPRMALAAVVAAALVPPLRPAARLETMALAAVVVALARLAVSAPKA